MYLCMLYYLVFLTTLVIIYPCLIVKETHSAIWILKKAEESAKRANTMGCRSVVKRICPCTKNLIELTSFIQRFSNVATATLVTIPLPLCIIMYGDEL